MLEGGTTSFDIVVTAQDGITTKTIRMNLVRQPNTDSTLYSLRVDIGNPAIDGAGVYTDSDVVLTPPFNPSTTDYTVSVANHDHDTT